MRLIDLHILGRRKKAEQLICLKYYSKYWMIYRTKTQLITRIMELPSYIVGYANILFLWFQFIKFNVLNVHLEVNHVANSQGIIKKFQQYSMNRSSRIIQQIAGKNNFVNIIQFFNFMTQL